MKLVLSPKFLAQLRREFLFLRERNVAAAVDQIRRIISTVERLEQFPHSGRAWRSADSLELVVPRSPYIVVYRIRGDTVDVLSIFHAARQYPPLH